jgi:putative endonuclease
MPQLDVATYIGQVTWFVAVFSAFYIIMTSDVLPMFNRAVKARTEKLARSRGDSRQFDTHRESASTGFNTAGSSETGRSLGLFSMMVRTSSAAARVKLMALAAKARPAKINRKLQTIVRHATQAASVANATSSSAPAKASAASSVAKTASTATVQAPKASPAAKAPKAPKAPAAPKTPKSTKSAAPVKEVKAPKAAQAPRKSKKSN